MGPWAEGGRTRQALASEGPGSRLCSQDCRVGVGFRPRGTGREWGPAGSGAPEQPVIVLANRRDFPKGAQVGSDGGGLSV